MQYGVHSIVPTATGDAMPCGRAALLPERPFRVAHVVFHSLSLHPAAIASCFNSSSIAPAARPFVPAHIAVRPGCQPPAGEFDTGRLVS